MINLSPVAHVQCIHSFVPEALLPYSMALGLDLDYNCFVNHHKTQPPASRCLRCQCASHIGLQLDGMGTSSSHRAEEWVVALSSNRERSGIRMGASPCGFGGNDGDVLF